MAMVNGTPRKGLPDIVFERMHRAIKSGAYKPDERLPTEHDLASEFEVSRPVIREALKRLRDQGLVYSRRGAGSFVRALGLREPLGFGQLENIADLLNCYEFRLTLEPAAAEAAAVRHDEAAMTGIFQALELMRDATNRQSHREDADYQFHLAISRAAQNNYFSTAMEALKEHIAVGMKFHGASIKKEASGLIRVFDEHEAIAKAISARDGKAARQLMHAHLAGSRERLFLSSARE
ncbi:FadR/GntR family transcriptional regulator [Rhizobium oryziradicis]|uniref:GntR family transcriptional regulator n=1 Tax=Rhizobium oryziradicis TaxID=1867956 RepID=A0A1Q8ZWJ3_9HYPH|nr:FadR/GntR family transcriptional regulator [Rhizobium oryziradicis]OLP46426.1 GntR family transcriptional regulator [Rhizobium oryziradicis]